MLIEQPRTLTAAVKQLSDRVRSLEVRPAVSTARALAFSVDNAHEFKGESVVTIAATLGSITFPAAFAGRPLVIASPGAQATVGNAMRSISVYAVSGTGFQIAAMRIVEGQMPTWCPDGESFTVNWLAIGPLA